MKRQLPGGVSPFETRSRPSVFNKLPPEEMISRLGEAVIWLRALPTPYTRPGRMAMPDAPETDGKGYVYSYQRTVRIPEEEAQLQAVSGNRYFTQYAPIHRVNSMHVFRNAAQGGDIPIKVQETGENYIDIVPDPGIKRYHQVLIDYEARMHERKSCTIIQESDGRTLNLATHPELITDEQGKFINVCVKALEIYRLEPTGKYTKLTDFKHDFTKLTLNDFRAAGTEYKVILEIFHTIPVAYRSIDMKKIPAGAIDVTEGDLDAVTSPYYRITEGDIFILTNAIRPEKEISSRMADGRFRLSKSPVAAISEILALTPEGQVDVDPESVSIEEFQYIRLPEDREYSRISVVYDHYPQYRVKKQIEFSGLQGRLQPVKWRLSPDNTNIVLA